MRETREGARNICSRGERACIISDGAQLDLDILDFATKREKIKINKKSKETSLYRKKKKEEIYIF